MGKRYRNKQVRTTRVRRGKKVDIRREWKIKSRGEQGAQNEKVRDSTTVVETME